VTERSSRDGPARAGPGIHEHPSRVKKPNPGALSDGPVFLDFRARRFRGAPENEQIVVRRWADFPPPQAGEGRGWGLEDAYVRI